MRHLLPCPPCGRQGRPGEGFLAGSNTSEPRGSAPRERDHRGGDHPVPSRTRQLSPPSPRVLQRKAAGGQGVALAEGAFLYAPIGRRPPTGRRPPLPGRARGAPRARARREGPRGDRPLRAFARLGAGLRLLGGPARAASRRAQERRAAVCGPWLCRRRARGMSRDGAPEGARRGAAGRPCPDGDRRRGRLRAYRAVGPAG